MLHPIHKSVCCRDTSYQQHGLGLAYARTCRGMPYTHEQVCWRKTNGKTRAQTEAPYSRRATTRKSLRQDLTERKVVSMVTDHHYAKKREHPNTTSTDYAPPPTAPLIGALRGPVVKWSLSPLHTTERRTEATRGHHLTQLGCSHSLDHVR